MKKGNWFFFLIQFKFQEAQSKFELDPASGEEIVIDPADGILDSEGSSSLHFKRKTSTPIIQRINVKVCSRIVDPLRSFVFYSFYVPFDNSYKGECFSKVLTHFVLCP